MHWDGDDAWFEGQIISFSPQDFMHEVQYADGDRQMECLPLEKVLIRSPTEPPSAEQLVEMGGALIHKAEGLNSEADQITGRTGPARVQQSALQAKARLLIKLAEQAMGAADVMEEIERRRDRGRQKRPLETSGPKEGTKIQPVEAKEAPEAAQQSEKIARRRNKGVTTSSAQVSPPPISSEPLEESKPAALPSSRSKRSSQDLSSPHPKTLSASSAQLVSTSQKKRVRGSAPPQSAQPLSLPIIPEQDVVKSEENVRDLENPVLLKKKAPGSSKALRSREAGQETSAVPALAEVSSMKKSTRGSNSVKPDPAATDAPLPSAAPQIPLPPLPSSLPLAQTDPSAGVVRVRTSSSIFAPSAFVVPAVSEPDDDSYVSNLLSSSEGSRQRQCYRVLCGTKQGLLVMPQEGTDEQMSVVCCCASCAANTGVSSGEEDRMMKLGRYEDHCGQGRCKKPKASIRLRAILARVARASEGLVPDIKEADPSSASGSGGVKEFSYVSLGSWLLAGQGSEGIPLASKVRPRTSSQGPGSMNEDSLILQGPRPRPRPASASVASGKSNQSGETKVCKHENCSHSLRLNQKCLFCLPHCPQGANCATPAHRAFASGELVDDGEGEGGPKAKRRKTVGWEGVGSIGGSLGSLGLGGEGGENEKDISRFFVDMPDVLAWIQDEANEEAIERFKGWNDKLTSVISDKPLPSMPVGARLVPIEEAKGILDELSRQPINLKLMESTNLCRSVAMLRSHRNLGVAEMALKVVVAWKTHATAALERANHLLGKRNKKKDH